MSHTGRAGREGIARGHENQSPAATAVDSTGAGPYMPPLLQPTPFGPARPSREDKAMKVRSSLKSLKTRHRDCKLVRRKGRIYVINKTDPRFKAKQG